MHEDAEGSSLAPKSLVVIAGPTASGKTELAVELARRLSGEVLSMDSRQLYRHFDAGTAKPERDAGGCVRGIPYHLVDCLEPGARIDAGRFAALARPLLEEVRRRGKRPLLAGGTGLYLKAILEGLDPLPPGDPEVRRRLEKEASEKGRRSLHDRLGKIDPAAAAKIPPNNIQRVVRALEVRELTGRPISEFWTSKTPLERSEVFTIDWPPEVLRGRITRRCRSMWPKMLDEVRGLREKYSGREPAFESLGYREALECVEGGLSTERGLEKMTAATLAYAKRQRTWFRNQTASIPIKGAEPEKMTEMVLAQLEGIQ